VKYCGGCNAGYDRAAFVAALERDFPAHTFRYAHEGDREGDCLLVVCGCAVRCAATAGLRGRCVTVSGPGDFGGAYGMLETLSP
jgi:hypothetical protein